MAGPRKESEEFVLSMIHAWMEVHDFQPLVRAARANFNSLVGKVERIIAFRKNDREKIYDKARSVVIQTALGQLKVTLTDAHFVIFRQDETVGFILEEAFGAELGKHTDKILIPDQPRVVGIIATCLFSKRDRPVDTDEVTVFLHMFCSPGKEVDRDTSLRYKSMIWFVYLLREIIRCDGAKVCGGENSPAYLVKRLRILFNLAREGKIINTDPMVPKPDYDRGKWNGTLFGWMQGDESRPLLDRLWKQFNLDGSRKNVNRLLLPKHRNCLSRQALATFCPH
jgi:hypothetical protein